MVEDELIGLFGSEEFISIATGYKQSVSKAPAVASVIDARQIKRMGANDIDEVLESIPGLHVSYSHQANFPIYTFRGIYSNFNPQVLFLIDGVPQTNLYTGGKNFVWGGMSVEGIERIEVIRGPGSAIYGADAFSGVINIITKGDFALEDQGNLGVKYGSFGSQSVFGNFHKKNDLVSISLNAQYLQTDGHAEKVERDLQSSLDQITGTSASLAPGSLSNSREMLDLNLDFRISDWVFKGNYQGRKDVGLGAGIAQALDPSGRVNSDRLLISGEYQLPTFIDKLEIEVSASYLSVTQEVERDAKVFPAGSTGPFLTSSGEPMFGYFPQGVIGNPEVFERHSRFNAVFHYKGVDDHDLTLGSGYYYGDLYKVQEEKNFCTDFASCEFILPQLETAALADVTDTQYAFLQEGDRENTYIYLQDVFSIANDWQVTAGLRYDKYSDFGDTVNPRLAVVWSTSKDLTTKFLYGEAFRAPAFVETLAQNNPAGLGNPDLEPETLKSYEIVFDYQARYDLGIVFNAFYYEWDDIILFVPDQTGSTSTAQNFGRQTGRGFEVEAHWSLTSQVELLANYALQHSTNTRTDTDSANSPEQQAYLQADWEFLPNRSIGLQANWVKDRNREIQDIREDIDDYLIFNITLREEEFLDKFEIALMIKNIFDEDVREPTPNGFPQPGIPFDLPLSGRTITGEIRYNF